MHKSISSLVAIGFCIFLAGAVWGQAPAPPMLQQATSLQLLANEAGGAVQFVRLTTVNPGAAASASVTIDGDTARTVSVEPGEQKIDVAIPATAAEKTVTVTLTVDGQAPETASVLVRPVRPWTVYLLPHSHVDIGYTKVQTEVEADQVRFLDMAVDEAQRTASFPEGSRFRWNSEVMWAVDGFFRTAAPERKEALLEAVRAGSIGLDALYGNELTGLCRPEELVRLTTYASRVRDEYQVPVDTAMISDVPGYTWGLMTVLAQSGVRYFSVGPNRSDRIGTVLKLWGDRPFYWISPSGQEKVLCWIAAQGYSWFHGKGGTVGDKVLTYLNDLETNRYPYDMVQLRYNIGGDNGPPDLTISDYVREWNAKYEYPKMRISLVRECFEDFENKYGADLPVFSGDMTPYWEDGAASSARETVLNRVAAERLTQAETLWTMLRPQEYPRDRFDTSWRNVILYDEHTWGAHNSISEPDSDFVKAQWDIKQAFAVDAERESQALVNDAFSALRADAGPVQSVLVFNTCSWARSQLVSIDAGTPTAGDRVTRNGEAIPSQRLSSGELAFVARDIPGLSAFRYDFSSEGALAEGNARVDGVTISNGLVTAVADPKTGTIKSMTSPHTNEDLVNTQRGNGLNEYMYVPGTDPKGVMRSGSCTVSVKDAGPVVATMALSSGAPSTASWVRELRVVDGLPYLLINNQIDKHKQRKKEGVHIAFPFNVPDGAVRVDLAWSVIRADRDQLPASCKNWMTAQRWVDVSNNAYGVTWATLDAPLVELGSPTAESPWIERFDPTQTILSYVMNNYWHTNYRDSQEGPHTFRYALQPHGAFSTAQAQRFGIEQSQPLMVAPVSREQADIAAPWVILPQDAFLTALKRSDDGQATVARLFSAAGQPVQATITRPDGTAPTMWLSDMSERAGSAVSGPIAIPAFGVVTVRLEN